MSDKILLENRDGVLVLDFGCLACGGDLSVGVPAHVPVTAFVRAGDLGFDVPQAVFMARAGNQPFGVGVDQMDLNFHASVVGIGFIFNQNFGDVDVFVIRVPVIHIDVATAQKQGAQHQPEQKMESLLLHDSLL